MATPSPSPERKPRRPERQRGAGSGEGADSAFEEMIRARPVVHRPGGPQHQAAGEAAAREPKSGPENGR